MRLSYALNTVTPLSKFLALFLFLFLSLGGFFLGVRYQQSMNDLDSVDQRLRIFATKEECESFVQRKCLPTLCEKDPNHVSCASNNQKGWFATHQPLNSGQILTDAMSNWKTYRNKEYRFEFKYPKDFEISEFLDRIILTDLKHRAKKSGQVVSISFNKPEIATRENFPKFVESKRESINISPFTKASDKEKIVINDNFESYKLNVDTEGTPYEDIFIYSDGRVISINTPSFYELDEEYVTYTIYKILSTFRFLDEEKITK